MMPNCQYRRCKDVATETLGELCYPNSKDGYGKVWQQRVYLCPKHAKRIRKLLEIPEPKEVKS